MFTIHKIIKFLVFWTVWSIAFYIDRQVEPIIYFLTAIVSLWGLGSICCRIDHWQNKDEF